MELVRYGLLLRISFTIYVEERTQKHRSIKFLQFAKTIEEIWCKILFSVFNCKFNWPRRSSKSKVVPVHPIEGYINLLPNELIPWGRVLPENVIYSQLLNIFPAFYGTRNFITVFTRTRHLFLSWARSIQSMHPPPHPASRSSILTLSTHPRLGLPSGLLPSGFSTKFLFAPLLSPYVLHVLPISVLLTRSSAWYLVRSTERKAPC